MSRHQDSQHRLTQARKAGLNAREINSALSAQPATADAASDTDANGFVWSIDENGHRTCKPANDAEQ
ncbi:MAG: hypothetical protein ACRC33_31605 [Gemmataceae bacterium]